MQRDVKRDKTELADSNSNQMSSPLGGAATPPVGCFSCYE